MKAKAYNPYIEANKNLSKKIDKLEKELRNTYKYKEMFESAIVKAEHLEKTLSLKRSLVKIIGRTEGNDLYALAVKDFQDTPEGLYVEVYLPEIKESQSWIINGKNCL